MKLLIRKWALVLITIFITGLILINILAYNHAYSMMHFSSTGTTTASPESLSFFAKVKTLLCGVKTVCPEFPQNLTDSILSYKNFLIPCGDSIQLGSLYKTGNLKSSIVLLFHGYNAEKSVLLTEAELLHNLGYSVLLIDFRGSGTSSESYTTIGYREADDVQASFIYAQDSLGYKHIILYGQSMGAAAILRALHTSKIMPDAIVIESVFDRMDNTVMHRFEAMGIPAFPSAHLLMFWGGFQMGFNSFRHNPIDYANSVRCPALFLHGVNDPRAYLSEGRAVYNMISTRKSFVEFENTVHEPLADKMPLIWTNALTDFFVDYSIIQ